MKQIDFESGNIKQNIFFSAVPMLAAQLLHLLYNIVDRIFIGRIPGEGADALAGVGLCFPVVIMILAFAGMYGSGGGPLCSMELGREDPEKAERIMNTSFSLLLGTSILVTAAGFLFMKPMLLLFGASEVTLRYAVDYLSIYLLGTVFAMIASGITPFINAQGFTSTGMMSVFIGAITNMILDPVFIFAMGLGVRGAAIATVISQGLSAAFCLRFLTSEKADLRIRRSQVLHPDRALSGKIIWLGFSMFITHFTNSLVTIVCNRMLSIYGGDLYISIYAILSSVRQVFDVPTGAITEGSSPVVSYNYGAGRSEKTRESIRLMCLAAFVYSLTAWGLISLFPSAFIRIFTSDTHVIATAVPLLHIYFFAFVFQALQYGGQTTFRSLGMKNHAIFFSLFRKVIIVVPLTILFPKLFPLLGASPIQGIFAAEPVSNVIGGTACFTTMYILIYRKLQKGLFPD